MTSARPSVFVAQVQQPWGLTKVAMTLKIHTGTMPKFGLLSWIPLRPYFLRGWGPKKVPCNDFGPLKKN
jgi:hypothetical protein